MKDMKKKYTVPQAAQNPVAVEDIITSSVLIDSGDGYGEIGEY